MRAGAGFEQLAVALPCPTQLKIAAEKHFRTIHLRCIIKTRRLPLTASKQKVIDRRLIGAILLLGQPSPHLLQILTWSRQLAEMKTRRKLGREAQLPVFENCAEQPRHPRLQATLGVRGASRFLMDVVVRVRLTGGATITGRPVASLRDLRLRIPQRP